MVTIFDLLPNALIFIVFLVFGFYLFLPPHILSSFFSSHPGKFINKILQTFLGLPNTLANMRRKHVSQPGLKFTFHSVLLLSF